MIILGRERIRQIVIIQSKWLVQVVSECCISKKTLATKLFIWVFNVLILLKNRRNIPSMNLFMIFFATTTTTPLGV